MACVLLFRLRRRSGLKGCCSSQSPSGLVAVVGASHKKELLRGPCSVPRLARCAPPRASSLSRQPTTRRVASVSPRRHPYMAWPPARHDPSCYSILLSCGRVRIRVRAVVYGGGAPHPPPTPAAPLAGPGEQEDACPRHVPYVHAAAGAGPGLLSIRPLVFPLRRRETWSMGTGRPDLTAPGLARLRSCVAAPTPVVRPPGYVGPAVEARPHGATPTPLAGALRVLVAYDAGHTARASRIVSVVCPQPSTTYRQAQAGRARVLRQGNIWYVV
jgi:hypothetical protein